MNKISVAALVAGIIVVAGVAPSFADSNGSVNLSVVKATLSSGTETSATSGTLVAAAMLDFGSPPSGQIPILFNDRHVYARPDVLRRDRVLAAIVRGGVILVPLRSMFEAMGSTVTYDGASKSVTAKKEGASVTVTLGKSEAVINGETRPLDQGPIMFQGHLLVPVRVMSEALGAYVEWVPSKRVVVVRYKPPAPVPPPTAPPTPVPTPTPAPSPTPGYVAFLQAADMFGTVYNEFTDGGVHDTGGTSNIGGGGIGGSWLVKGAYKFDPWAVVVDWRQDTYQTPTDGVIPPVTSPISVCNPSVPPAPETPGGPATFFNTIDGGTCFVPPFRARQSTLDGRIEYRIWQPMIYIGVGYIQASNNYGYATLHAFGAGVEKLQTFHPGGIDWFASAFYYPNASGDVIISDPNSPNFGISFRQEYQITKYDIGINYNIGSSPFYLFGGYDGDRYNAKPIACPNDGKCGPGAIGAPISQTHSGPYVGLGVHF